MARLHLSDKEYRELFGDQDGNTVDELKKARIELLKAKAETERIKAKNLQKKHEITQKTPKNADNGGEGASLLLLVFGWLFVVFEFVVALCWIYK